MPSRTTHRAESKYNVTTEFPHLGLHSAAANGNIGLVKYALSHGQPINSVLDGVLPLHAASSGGSDLVVKLLIEQGADVNASRLPRRYSDRHRDTSAPIVGSSGSTPLHFAAANGHTSVVRTLLLHGAHVDRADKHGVTPEMLARENGKEGTADLLKEWLENRDRDLRERGAEAGNASGSGSGFVADKRTSCIGPLDSLERKRLHVKQSIDHALNTLKSHAHSDSHTHTLADTPSKKHPSPGESTSPFGEYTFYPTPDVDANDDSSSRRPSLPHIYDGLPVPSSSKRPRSAGQDAEPEPPRAPSVQRKLGSKYSLLNLFRKASDTPNAGHSTPDSPYNASSTPSTPSASPSPAPGTIPLPSSPRFNPAHLLPSSPPESSPLANRHRPRMASDTSLGSTDPSATDLHDSLAEHVRNRSGSGSRRAFDEDIGAEGSGRHTPSSRPGILLRNHHRASSSSQSQIQGASFRALRFEASSSTSSLSAKARNGVIRVFGLERSLSPPRVMQKSSSASSLIAECDAGQEGDERLLDSDPIPETIVDFEDAAVDADEEEYGEVIDRLEGASKSRLMELKTEGRPRGSSFASSTSSLSPNMSPDSAIVSTAQEFPFSIDYPPPTDVLDEQLLTVPYPSSPQGASDNRLRGNSISSMSTDGSANPQLSWSSTTATSSIGSGSMTTPATSNITLPGPGISSPRSIPREIPRVTQDDKDPSYDAPPDQHSSFGLRRSHIPTDIDIRSISSHAQAEALVQRAQQSILEMDDIPDDNLLSSGRSPLSAKLAAYGESLALERRLKRVEEGMTGEDSLSAEESEVPAVAVFTRDAGRKTASPRIRDMRALEGPKSMNTSRSRIRQPRRPNTSDSASSTKSSFLFTNERARGYHHQPSHSASIVGTYPQSTEDVTIIGHSPTPQPSLLSPHSPPQHSTNLPPLNRSRTPDPASDDLTTVDHVPLSRCITAPAAESFADVLAANGKHDSTTRLMTSASKLTRMGFSSKDGSQPAGSISVSPRSHEPKSRFGIKSLFKGKS